MINNDFHIIGIATSEMENISNESFTSYLLRLEVERVGASKQKTTEIVVQIYGTNRAIDPKQQIMGKTIVVNGYIDSYLTKEQKIITKLIAQNIYVVDRDLNSGTYDKYDDIEVPF